MMLSIGVQVRMMAEGSAVFFGQLPNVLDRRQQPKMEK